VTLNKSAVELTGFSDEDLARDPALWSRRIFADDRPAFEQHQERMARRDLQTSCDYRLFPQDGRPPIWLRDVTIPLAGFDHPFWLSFYLRLTDREREESSINKMTADISRDSIERCFHELKNRLHLLSMELELANLESAETLDTGKMTTALRAIGDSIKVLQQYLVPAPGRHSD
jgi:hypothetical protein